jgi:hypothetical protein
MHLIRFYMKIKIKLIRFLLKMVKLIISTLLIKFLSKILKVKNKLLTKLIFNSFKIFKAFNIKYYLVNNFYSIF